VNRPSDLGPGGLDRSPQPASGLPKAQGHTIVVEKSTLPVPRPETVKAITGPNQEHSAPRRWPVPKLSPCLQSEFLPKGPRRGISRTPIGLLIGGDETAAIEAPSGRSMATGWHRSGSLRTNLWSKDSSSLTAIAFLAQRISSINSIAALCEPYRSTNVRVGGTGDRPVTSRIGNALPAQGQALAAACLQKDILNLVYLCRQLPAGGGGPVTAAGG